MESNIETHLDFLGLKHLKDEWNRVIKDAREHSPSYQNFLCNIIKNEYEHKTEQRRLARIKNAKIPEMLAMNTFPFTRQPKLKKKLVLQLFDSQSFILENQVLLFIGPTGCGKTGLGTSFLMHAINNNYTGLFIDFKDLMKKLYQSCADNSGLRVVKKLANIDCLHIDEFGYAAIEEQQAGLFFDLMKTRHKRKCTIITSQLGFEKWPSIIKNEHINAAIIDRITENCTVFNMTKCVSLRKKNIIYGTEKDNNN
jgi:DNA replication protein DnaC